MAPVEGDLKPHHQVYGERPYQVATLQLANSSMAEVAFSPLYVSVLVAIVADGLRLRGYERLEDGQTVVQGWLCEVVRFVVAPPNN